MSDITDLASFDAVYQIETTDLVLGGVNGVANRQGQQLANRTKWLRARIESHEAAADPHAQYATDAALAAALAALVPRGMVMMWSGSSSAIPAGWALCNGLLGTPDLRDRFVVGAGQNYPVAATGGAATVALSVAEMPAHAHPGSYSDTTGAHAHGITVNDGGAHSHTVAMIRGGDGGQGSDYDFYVPANSENSASPENRGGAVSAAPTSSAGNHAHTAIVAANGAHGHLVTVAAQGGGGAHENRPPYYALCYVMKL